MRVAPIALACLTLLAAAPAAAQEGPLSGLGWFTWHPGSAIDGTSQLVDAGNAASADIATTGGEAAVGAGIAGSLRLVSTVQANTIGVSALDVRGTQLGVLHNRVEGMVRAIGGAASANTVLLSGGSERRALAGSVQVLHNRANGIEAMGVNASIALGAASVQLPGRVAANAVLADGGPLRGLQMHVSHNRAEALATLGGAVLANSSTLAASDVNGLRLLQDRNQVSGIVSGGVKAGLGWGQLAEVDLSGVSAGNALLVADATVRGMQVLQQRNQAEALSSLGGSALANSVQVAGKQGDTVRDYSVHQHDSRARDIHARGAEVKLLGGALASLQAGAVALANSASLLDSSLRQPASHRLERNHANDVHAVGGAALANSIWLQQSASQHSPVLLADNRARDISTASGGVSIGAGVVGAFQRNGRALANSVALDAGAQLNDAPTVLRDNSAEGVRGGGGVAAANTVLLSKGTVQGTDLLLADNQASALQSTGFKAEVGGGLIGSAQQNALVLANTLGVFNARVDAKGLTLRDNRASALDAQGGKLMANSVSVEGEGRGATLSARTTVLRNRAAQASTGASSIAGPVHVFSKEQNARAALNAVVLRDGASADAQSTLQLSHQSASLVSALGGTALVNTVGAYRGARIDASTLALSRNEASDVRAGGGSSQAGGIGKARNGVLVVNGVYLDGGEDAVSLQGVRLGVQGNEARTVQADGGRVNVNALAVNGQGEVRDSAVLLSGNQATDVRSFTEERTVLGASLGGGVGHASANAVQVYGTLRDSRVRLLDNEARAVSAHKDAALANSLAGAQDSVTNGLRLRISANRAEDVATPSEHRALANSVLNEGTVEQARIVVQRNRGGARAERDDAMAASVRNRARGSIGGETQVMLGGNRGKVHEQGTLNALDNHGVLKQAQIALLRNRGSVVGGGSVNSIVNGGSIIGGRILVLDNQGSAERGGVVNSVVNGPQGEMNGARITVMANRGKAVDGGIVNSVVNQKELHGEVAILRNNGRAEHGGIVNSVINQGKLTGRVVIADSTGSAGRGGIANSVINHGEISGRVTIHGSTAHAGSGEVGNQQTGSGVVLRTVTVGAGGVRFGS